MRPFAYRIFVEWSDADQAFVARVPAVGAAGHGDTAEDATRQARKAAEAMLDVLREERRPIPASDAVADYSGRVLLRLPRSLHEQLARRAEADGVSLNQELVALLAGSVLGDAGAGRKITSRRRSR